MSFAGSPGALAKPFHLLSSLPSAQWGSAAVGGFLFSHPKRGPCKSPRDVAGTRAAGSFGGELSACAGLSEGCWEAAVLFVWEGAS